MTSPGDDMRIACNGLTGRDLSERSIGRRPSVGWEGGLTIVPHAVEYRAVNVGGNWSNGLNAGVSYVNNNTVTNSNTNIGARLDSMEHSQPGSYSRLTSRSNTKTAQPGSVALNAKVRAVHVGAAGGPDAS